MKRNINTLALLAGLTLAGIFPTLLHAQTDYSARKATSRLGIGAGIAIGVALPVSVTLADGDEPAPGFAVRAGINISYPFSRKLGVLFNAGIDSRGLGKKASGETDNRIYRANYFFLEPGVSISAFRMSVNIGLPTGVSQPRAASGVTSSDDLPGETLQTMIEPRIGATLVLMDLKDGWLGLNVDAGFTFNKLYNETLAAGYPNDIPSAHALSAHLGVTWQFAIPGTGGF